MGVILAPILEGKLDAWKQWASKLSGSEDKRDINSRYDLTKHEAWLAETPMGPAVIAILEGPGSSDFMPKLATSDNEVDNRFKAKLLELHGMDVSKPPPGPMPEKVIG